MIYSNKNSKEVESLGSKKEEHETIQVSIGVFILKGLLGLGLTCL